MKTKEIILERATDIVYHYTNVTSAIKILDSGVFKLSTVTGTDAEQGYAPPGYPYFLSLSRSKVGDYSRYTGPSGAMFVLDGQWLSDRYVVKPVDFWYAGKTQKDLKKGEWKTIDPLSKNPMWLNNPDRGRETEDRLFSKKNTVPITPITAIHFYIRQPDERHGRWIRAALLLAKKRGIKTYLYNDIDAWRSQITSKTVSADQMGSLLKSARETNVWYERPVRGINGYGRSPLLDWIELIKKPRGQELSKSADKLLYNIKYYGEAGSTLKNDLHNARKPNSKEYELAVKITDYLTKNKLDINTLVNAIKSKWK